MTCESSGDPVSVDVIVTRIERQGVRYVFVGERHDARAPKRLAVELVNRLVGRGHDAALYVEGFRTDCDPGEPSCRSLASRFNGPAFAELLAHSRAPVRPLDPPARHQRVARMAATLSSGTETVLVVLVGNAHVLYAGQPDAELSIFGGGMRYPDPGDLAESFPRNHSLTLAYESAHGSVGQFAVRPDGCKADYLLAELEGDLISHRAGR